MLDFFPRRLIILLFFGLECDFAPVSMSIAVDNELGLKIYLSEKSTRTELQRVIRMNVPCTGPNLLSSAFNSGSVFSVSSCSSASFIFFSGSGFGCDANSSSLAESLSCLADSTGPKTLVLSRWLLALVVLERDDLAILRAR